MEQKFGINSIDLQVLRDFCEREGESVTYEKGEQMEREGDASLHRHRVASAPQRHRLVPKHHALDPLDDSPRHHLRAMTGDLPLHRFYVVFVGFIWFSL